MSDNIQYMADIFKNQLTLSEFAAEHIQDNICF
jgi:hypothetical protein